MKTLEIKVPEGKKAEWINGVLTLIDEKDNRPVTERIKTLDDAISELGEEHPYVAAYRLNEEIDECDNDILAYLSLRIICAALNEGWVAPQDCSTYVYWSWFYLYTKEELENMSESDRKKLTMIDITDLFGTSAGFAYADPDNGPLYASAPVGSRLCFKSRELAIYCGKQFIDIWAEYLLIK